MINFLIGIAVAGLIFSLIAGVYFYSLMRERVKTLSGQVTVLQTSSQDLSSQVTSLNGQIKSLEEQLSAKRHTENSVAAHEDALAALMRLKIEQIKTLEEQEMQNRYLVGWIDRVAQILQISREGPRAYPVDAPTGNDWIRYKETNGKTHRQDRSVYDRS